MLNTTRPLSLTTKSDHTRPPQNGDIDDAHPQAYVSVFSVGNNQMKCHQLHLSSSNGENANQVQAMLELIHSFDLVNISIGLSTVDTFFIVNEPLATVSHTK